MTVKSTTKNGLTKAQISAFWKAFSSACQNLGLRGHVETENYRKKVLVDETGKESIKALNRTKDFDAVMHRLSADAGNWEMAAKFAAGDEYRVAVMINIVCRQIMQLKGVPEGSDAAMNYLKGVLNQSKICTFEKRSDSSFWMDISRDSALSVFAMLDIHRRRLLTGYVQSCETLKSFDPTIVYKPHDGGLKLIFDKSAYADFNTLKVSVKAS